MGGRHLGTRQAPLVYGGIGRTVALGALGALGVHVAPRCVSRPPRRRVRRTRIAASEAAFAGLAAVAALRIGGSGAARLPTRSSDAAASIHMLSDYLRHGFESEYDFLYKALGLIR
ncbi:MAG TPA: hypothetical protein VGC30_12995 [Dokdonella sp.]